MYRLAFIGLAALSLGACATTSQDSETAALASAGSGAGESDEVCRRVQVTGSRFHREVCRTQAEWDREAQDARDATSRMQNGLEPAACVRTNSC